MRNNKGITLISLIITIIVLVILVTVSIYAGDGTIKYANYNRAKSEFATLQSNVNIWHDKYESIEVKDTEIPNGYTKEQVLLNKQQIFLEQYGVETTDESCDQTELNNTIQTVIEKGDSINAQDFRFLSAQYLKNNLGFGSSYDFLVNIPDRKIILFGGIEYNGIDYYTAEDFKIQNVESNNAPNSISFDLQQEGSKQIVVSNLKLYDKESMPSDISKFIIQYKKSSEDTWIDATNKLTQYTENSQIKYRVGVDTV